MPDKLGDKAAAVASINQALVMVPDFPPALDVLKKVVANVKKRGKPAAAISAARAKDDWQICVFPVTDIGQPKQAMAVVIDACSELINSDGGNDENRAVVHLQRGSTYRRLGKFEPALVNFSESLRHDPNSTDAYTGLGNAYRGLKLYDRAIAAHSEAIRLKPDFATAYNNRGNVYQDMDDNDRAIADYDMAIKLDPNYAAAYYNRGNARNTAGDRDGAAADYREAATLNPHLKQATEMLRQVDKKL
jgi:tetratricopeptide (TPR) repeat protein